MSKNFSEIIKDVEIEMEKLEKSLSPTLDRLEGEILKNMEFFGASSFDISNTSKWLRGEMNKSLRKMLVEEILHIVAKKREV